MSIAMKLNQVFSSVKATKEKPSEEAQKPKEVATASKALTDTTGKHKSGKFFEDIESKLKSDGAALVTKVNAIVEFKVDCENNQCISYIVDLKNAPGRVFVNDGGFASFLISLRLKFKFKFKC